MSSTGMKDVRIAWEGHQGGKRVTLLAFNVTGEEAAGLAWELKQGAASKLLGMLECELNADLFICDHDEPLEDDENYW